MKGSAVLSAHHQNNLTADKKYKLQEFVGFF
jgi:hypothetical protein